MLHKNILYILFNQITGVGQKVLDNLSETQVVRQKKRFNSHRSVRRASYIASNVSTIFLLLCMEALKICVTLNDIIIVVAKYLSPEPFSELNPKILADVAAIRNKFKIAWKHNIRY